MKKRILLAKNKGNITSIFLGQMIMLLLFVYALFTVRLQLLNTTFNFIDDAVVTSMIGGLLPNQAFFGQSNQVVMHEADKYVNVTTGTNGFTSDELAIELSMIPWNTTVDSDSIQPKKKLDIDYRNQKSLNHNNPSATISYSDDYYLRRAISAIISNLTYNISNGYVKTSKSAENPISRLSNISELNSHMSYNNIKIDKSSIVNRALLGSYITSDIEVTRLDLYNLYRAHLAKEIRYRSPFFTVTDSHGIEWTDLGGGAKANNWESFQAIYNPGAPNYDLVERRWLKDVGIKMDGTKVTTDASGHTVSTEGQYYKFSKSNNSKYLYYYIDSGITYQGKKAPEAVTDSTSPYKYFYANGSGNFELTSMPNPIVVNVNKPAPVASCSVLSYKSSNSPYGYTGGMNYTQSKYNVNQNSPGVIRIQGGKLANKVINNTSGYIELTFSIKVFPNLLNGKVVTPSQKVTIARLVDIEATNNKAL